jgi:hypothetical protein
MRTVYLVYSCCFPLPYGGIPIKELELIDLCPRSEDKFPVRSDSCSCGGEVHYLEGSEILSVNGERTVDIEVQIVCIQPPGAKTERFSCPHEISVNCSAVGSHGTGYPLSAAYDMDAIWTYAPYAI